MIEVGSKATVTLVSCEDSESGCMGCRTTVRYSCDECTKEHIASYRHENNCPPLWVSVRTRLYWNKEIGYRPTSLIFCTNECASKYLSNIE